jgi:glutathione synthase/RimK-type ligase-like ATP-grasp enzyme
MIKQFYTRVRSKNFSCDDLRGDIGPFPIRSLARLGSTTMTEMIFPRSFNKYPIIEINTVKSIQNSRSKLLMKGCFAKANVKQADWYKYIYTNDMHRFQDQLFKEEHVYNIENLPYPIVAKRIFGFKGHGMVLINNQEKLEKFLNSTSKTELAGYYFEEFKNYSREYRLHCTQDECFMSWRKLRKSDSKERWFFNSTNCNWVGENHNLFDKPVNWDKIIEDSCEAIKAVGLDIGAVDVRVQSANYEDKKRENPEYIVLEVNSAPAIGPIGVDIYRKKITELINKKIIKL